jgi:hypothetical protein
MGLWEWDYLGILDNSKAPFCSSFSHQDLEKGGEDGFGFTFKRGKTYTYRLLPFMLYACLILA